MKPEIKPEMKQEIDNAKCVRNTDKCEAEIWAKSKESEVEQ